MTISFSARAIFHGNSQSFIRLLECFKKDSTPLSVLYRLPNILNMCWKYGYIHEGRKTLIIIHFFWNRC